MAFQYLLNNLLVDVPGAQGAIFLDSEGESVEFTVTKDPKGLQAEQVVKL